MDDYLHVYRLNVPHYKCYNTKEEKQEWASEYEGYKSFIYFSNDKPNFFFVHYNY